MLTHTRKKLLLFLLALLVLSQAPFAFRRYQLGQLHAAIQRVNSQRLSASTNDKLTEYKGVVHVHSFLGGHAVGGFDEIISAAQANHLDFVAMTEHPSPNFNTAAMTLKGWHGSVLFINGGEIPTAEGDRLLILPRSEVVSAGGGLPTQEVLTGQKTSGALAFVAYPNEFKTWAAVGYDGVEVYNVFNNAQNINPMILFFDGLWSYRTYRELLFARFYERPTASLELWDAEVAARGKKLVAIAGNDAHANIGMTLTDTSGNRLLGFSLDPYQQAFRLVRLHVLIPREKPLDTGSLLDAVAAGHCFIGFDLFADSSGFRFTGTTRQETKMQGDEIRLDEAVRLSVSTPVPSRILLLRNGQVTEEASEITHKDFQIKQLGSYRVEVYLPQLPKLGGDQPWIISNPIYVR